MSLSNRFFHESQHSTIISLTTYRERETIENKTENRNHNGKAGFTVMPGLRIEISREDRAGPPWTVTPVQCYPKAVVP